MSAQPGVTSTEHENDAERQTADLAAFRRMLQVSSGTFSLSFAVCDDRKLRDSLIERFAAEFPGIAIVRLPAGVESIFTTATTQIGTQTPAAIFVLDIEASIPFGSAAQPALRVLNSSREHWERFRCPVVFWLAEYAITLLHSHAPDFWRYRSHQFEFVPEPVSLAELKDESFSGYPMVDALPYEEKAFRISELERRIREAGNPPSADLLPHALRWIHELTYLYQHFSQFQQAEKYLRKALNWAEIFYGSDHPQTADAIGNLGVLLKTMGRWGEAEPLLRHALEICEAIYDVDDHNLAIPINNLAQLLQAKDRLEEAEPLYRRALMIDESSYGPNHPRTANRLINFAELLKKANRVPEADSMIRRALEIDEANFGENHPRVAIDLNNLAGLLRASSQVSEAEAMMRRALQIDEAVYGPNHRVVAVRLNNLAGLLQTTNRESEAEPLIRRALVIHETSYGPSHYYVAVNLNNLARLLQDTNRLAEAEPLMRRALGIFVRSLGPEHPKSQTARHNYIGLLQALEVPEEEIQQRVLAVASKPQEESTRRL